MVHRWALLSNSPAWTVLDIRVVAANPRSFAYLDERRWLPLNNSDTTEEKEFRSPSTEEIRQCPEYDHWLWGLQDGGGDDLPCPYRDAAMEQVPSRSLLAERYAARDVIYLSGAHDMIPQDHDHCAALVQGRTRNERARNYFQGLQELFFGHPVHALHVVPSSGHDHALMFQSEVGRSAILSFELRPKTTKVDSSQQEADNRKKDVSQTARFIVPINRKEASGD